MGVGVNESIGGLKGGGGAWSLYPHPGIRQWRWNVIRHCVIYLEHLHTWYGKCQIPNNRTPMHIWMPQMPNNRAPMHIWIKNCSSWLNLKKYALSVIKKYSYFLHTDICLHVFLISLGPLLQNSAVKNYCNAVSTSYVAVYTLKVSLNRLCEILVWMVERQLRVRVHAKQTLLHNNTMDP